MPKLPVNFLSLSLGLLMGLLVSRIPFPALSALLSAQPTTAPSGALALSATHGAPETPRLAPSSALGWDKALRAASAARYMVSGASLMRVEPTGSMKPLFDERAVLLMEDASFEALKVGDIITYTHPRHSQPVVHRIISAEADGSFRCKGDANGRADEVAITRANYRARVFGIIYASEEGRGQAANY